MNSPLCASCAMAERRTESGFCSDRCALHFGYAMEDHTDPSLHNNGLIKLRPSNYISMAIKSTPKLGEALRNYEHTDGGYVLPEHVVYSLGARLYHIGVKREGDKGKKESKSKHAKQKAEQHISEVTDASDARALAEAALRRAAELEAAQAATLSAAAARASALPAPPPLPALTYSPPTTSLSVPTAAAAPPLPGPPSSLSVAPALMSSSSSPVPYAAPAPRTTAERGLIRRAEQYVRMTEQLMRNLLQRGELSGTYLASPLLPRDILNELLMYVGRVRPVVQNPERLHYVRTIEYDYEWGTKRVAFDKNGDLLALFANNRLLLFSGSDGSIIRKYAKRKLYDVRHDVVISSEGIIYIADMFVSKIEVWNASNVFLTEIHCKGARALALNFQESKLYVIGGGKNEIYIFDLSIPTSWTLLETIDVKWKSASLRSIALLSDDTLVASVSRDKKSASWLTRKAILLLSPKDHTLLAFVESPPSWSTLRSIIVDGADHIFISDSNYHGDENENFVLDKNGKIIATWDASVSGKKVVSHAIALHPSGMIGVEGDGFVYLFSSK